MTTNKKHQKDKGIIEISGEFKEWWMSPRFYKLITGEHPKVSTIEQANRYGKTPREMEKQK